MVAVLNLNEKQIEDILSKHHSFFIEKELTLKGRQINFQRKRADLVFKDRFGDTLIVEIKKGVIKRDHVAQVLDYLGEMIKETDERIRLMLIGRRVPPNWKNSLDQQGIEYREITPKDYSVFLYRKDKLLYDKFSKKGKEVTTESVIPAFSKSWEEVHNFAKKQNEKPIPILNPSNNSPFIITEVHSDYLKLDKLPVNLDKQMFDDTYNFIEKEKRWIKIGASRINTKPGTLEDYLKKNYFGGKKNSLSTATWIAAILVHACKNIEFNGKTRGQSIKFTPSSDNTQSNSDYYDRYPWSKPLEAIGVRFKTLYPESDISSLPSAGKNVKIHTKVPNIHFEWWIHGPKEIKTLEVGLHIEKQGDPLWNQQILDQLKSHQNEFDKLFDEKVIYGAHLSGRARFKDYKRISVEKEFKELDINVITWAVNRMKIFYDYYNPIISNLH